MNRQKNINRYSLKRIAEINAEVPIRLSLCNRVGGTPIIKDQTVKRHNEIFIIKRVFCVGGTCEVCDKPANSDEILEPHEINLRSHGGKVSLTNSIMCHRTCHRTIQNNEPKW